MNAPFLAPHVLEGLPITLLSPCAREWAYDIGLANHSPPMHKQQSLPRVGLMTKVGPIRDHHGFLFLPIVAGEALFLLTVAELRDVKPR